MNYISVCSGIEAASVAWKPLGWEATFFSEIDPFPSAVLAHHYPTVPNLGDMTKFKEWPDATIDVLVGGTPCQSFSVAGLRKGLADPRGNLMLTYLAIADRYRPRWLVWENVPGVLSSNGGRDFGTFLGGLGELGYGFAYRVLDAQYFGVPQRRRRVFVVGHLGDWRRAAAVLFERHSLQGHTAPSREKRETTPTIPSRRTAGGGLGTDFDCDGGLIPMHTTGAGFWQEGFGTPRTRTQDSHENLVTHTLRGEGFDASEDGTGRGTPLVPVSYRTSGNCGAWETGDRTDALTTFTDPNSHILVFNLRGREGGAMPEVSDIASLRAASGGSSRSYLPFVQNTRDEVRLMGGDGHIAGALAAEPGMKQQTYLLQSVNCPREKKQNGMGVSGDGAMYSLTARDLHGVATPSAVRRLTPRECERLQGFPDDYTLIPWRGKPAAACPDGPRYKALGNSMAVPCMKWIGERITLVDPIRKEDQL